MDEYLEIFGGNFSFEKIFLEIEWSFLTLPKEASNTFKKQSRFLHWHEKDWVPRTFESVQEFSDESLKKKELRFGNFWEFSAHLNPSHQLNGFNIKYLSRNTY
jgi:hypothetical protein